MNTEVSTIDDYIAMQSKEVQLKLIQLRELIQQLAPDATETISYGMPAFKYANSMLVYFAGFKKHCSLFPANAGLIKELEEDLKKYKTSKGTIQFELSKPLPIALIKKIVKARVNQNQEKLTKK